MPAAAAEKIPVTLRIDRDVVQCFKELGPGYQSRMNAVLRAYVTGHANDESERVHNTADAPHTKN